VPLAVDTFLLSATLGLAGLPKEQRIRTSLIFVAFEAGMPVLGVFAGRGVGAVLGPLAGYTAAAVIGLAGAQLLRRGHDDEKEHERLKLLATLGVWPPLTSASASVWMNSPSGSASDSFTYRCSPR